MYYMVQFIEFNAWEIDDALRNSHMVGEGGYGKVYKAVPEDRTVAIKVHKRESLQGEREFNQEVPSLFVSTSCHILILPPSKKYSFILFIYNI